MKCDRILIAGNFNIHVCCESSPSVNEFLDLNESFNFIQFIKGPTQEVKH